MAAFVTAGMRMPLSGFALTLLLFGSNAGAVVPEADAPDIFNRSWTLAAAIEVPDAGARGVIATMGGAPAGSW